MLTRFTVRLVGLASLVVASCRPAAPPVQSTHDPSTILPPLGTHRRAAAVCDSVAILWRATGRATVRSADTTTSVLSDSQPQHGCAVVAAASLGLDSAQATHLYWSYHGRPGWTDLSTFDADGPDGYSRVRERGDTRCQVDFTQDGGDDSDSTYVPSPAVGEVTFCWRRVQ